MTQPDADDIAELQNWYAEDERREAAIRNGQHPDDPGPKPEPQQDAGVHDRDVEPEQHRDEEPTTWEPVDLGPYLRGEVSQPQPSIGAHRSDGLQLIYPGREHA